MVNHLVKSGAKDGYLELKSDAEAVDSVVNILMFRLSGPRSINQKFTL
jgi:hypothetical protein